MTPIRTWTKEEEKLLGTLPDRVVAERIGATWNQVIRRRRALGISPRFGGFCTKITDEVLRACARDVARGLSQNEASIANKVSRGTVQRAVKKYPLGG